MVTSDIYRMTHLSLVCLSYSAVAVCNVCFVVVTHINISQLSFMCQLSHGNGSCSAGCPVLLSEKLHHTIAELTRKKLYHRMFTSYIIWVDVSSFTLFPVEFHLFQLLV